MYPILDGGSESVVAGARPLQGLDGTSSSGGVVVCVCGDPFAGKDICGPAGPALFIAGACFSINLMYRPFVPVRRHRMLCVMTSRAWQGLDEGREGIFTPLALFSEQKIYKMGRFDFDVYYHLGVTRYGRLFLTIEIWKPD